VKGEVLVFILLPSDLKVGNREQGTGNREQGTGKIPLSCLAVKLVS
jgi:hypothetical protein